MSARSLPLPASRRVAIGVALSMLAHIVVMWAVRPAPRPYSAAPAPTPLVLRLQPLQPMQPLQTVAAPEPVTAPVQQSPARKTPAARGKQASASRRVIAVAPNVSAPSAPALVLDTPPEAPTPAPSPKKFDLDAARATARSAGLRDAPNADDAPLARLKKQQQESEIRTESKAAQAISAAKRADCKDGLPGGLLAPLIMMTQKAGTGCKW